MKYKIINPPSLKLSVENESMLVDEDVDIEMDQDSSDILPVIFTRYLYIKEEVLTSLILSILEKQKDEAMFWAYELYNSGFQELVMEFILSMYNEMFKAHNPKLGRFLKARFDEWNADKSLTHILGTMVLNLCDPTRKFKVDGFITRKFPISSENIDSAFYIMFSKDDVLKYDSISGEIPRKVLEKACIYSTRKNVNSIFKCAHVELPADQLKDMLFYNWLYYASFSPIWADRISQFGGVISHETKTVEFVEPEDFYELYGLEPDEQRSVVIRKLTHYEGEVEQMTEEEFISRYNGCK